MDNTKYLLFIGIVAFLNSNLFSQRFTIPDYSIESGTSVSAGRETPFWLISDQYGLITPNKFNGWVKIGLQAHKSEVKKIDYDYCFELVNRYSNKNELYIHQAYLGLKLYFINIQAGNIEEKFGNQDSSLSSGGLLWSGNSRTIPKVSLIVPNYIKIPYTSGFVEIKGGISHGWLDNNQFIKHAWLHHKYGYIQLGGILPVHMHFGIHHFAQWGGKTVDGKQLPNTFDDYMKVFVAKQGGSDAPIDDELNALGNHIGSYNFGIDLSLSKIQMGVYWQTIFEDSCGIALKNIKDGLWGFSIHSKDRNKLINGFVYEFINTTDQSGPYSEYWLLNGQKYNYPVEGGEHIKEGENDDYFNNGIYQAGWTYQKMTIGTPFITSPVITTGNESSYIRNNKVTGHHFGIEGKYSHLSYKVYYSYYLNFGSNRDPIRPNQSQNSVLLQAYISDIMPWGIDICLKGGIDIGKMYGNNTGIQISLIKTGSF